MYNQANSKQIKLGAIADQHLSPTAAISESKLNIDWTARAIEILARRTVVDYVQVNGKAVSAASASVVVTPQISAPAATADSEKGAIVQDVKNFVIIRDSVTGEPLIGADGKEVYGKLTKPSADFIITFYTKDAEGDEVAHTIAGATTIDFQFPQRFDLNTVSETFASNEKFVDGAANVSERLDIAQIAKDVFGGSYTLDKDGAANLGTSVMAQLAAEVTARTDADDVLQDAIDAETTARVGAVNALSTRVSANETELLNARGGSANLAAELARIELAGTNSNTELVEARDSDVTGTHATVDERLEAGEARFEAVKTEVETARNGKASLTAELSAIRTAASGEATTRANADTALDGRATALEAEKHSHFAEDKQVLVGDPLIGTSSYVVQNVNKYVAGNLSLQVYINGQLQMVGVHYNEVEAGGAGTGGTGINFAPNLIEQDDVIQLRWSK